MEHSTMWRRGRGFGARRQDEHPAAITTSFPFRGERRESRDDAVRESVLVVGSRPLSQCAFDSLDARFQIYFAGRSRFSCFGHYRSSKVPVVLQVTSSGGRREGDVGFQTGTVNPFDCQTHASFEPVA